jgi:hypothetical protein
MASGLEHFLSAASTRFWILGMLLPPLQSICQHGWNSTTEQGYTPKGTTEKISISPQITSAWPVGGESKASIFLPTRKNDRK